MTPNILTMSLRWKADPKPHRDGRPRHMLQQLIRGVDGSLKWTNVPGVTADAPDVLVPAEKKPAHAKKEGV